MVACEKCERPSGVCECIPQDRMPCEAGITTVPGCVRHDGKAKMSPVACLHYGDKAPRPSWDSTTAHTFLSCFSVFHRHEDAHAFADFLNSDAIFECVIPERFRPSATT